MKKCLLLSLLCLSITTCLYAEESQSQAHSYITKNDNPEYTLAKQLKATQGLSITPYRLKIQLRYQEGKKPFTTDIPSIKIGNALPITDELFTSAIPY